MTTPSIPSNAPHPADPARGAAPLPRRTALVLYPLLALAAAIVFTAARPADRGRRFEIDEAEWLTMSIANARQAFEGLSPFEGVPPSPYRDEDGNPWKVGIHRSTFGFMNPMLPKLLFGGLCLALGHREFDPAVYPRFAKEVPPAHRAHASAPVAGAREPVRAVVLALASLSAALVFALARRAAGSLAAGLAFALFLASPNVLDHATRIRTDFFPLALGLAAAAVAMRGWRPLGGARGAGRAAGVAACLGLLAGLAVGSKLNGALVAIMVGAWCVVAWLAARREPAPGSGTPAVSFARGPLVAWAVSGAPCVALFVLFSPHLWPAPVENLRELLEAWEGDVAHQKDLYGERLGRADSLAGHLALASRAVVGEHEPFRAWLGAPIGGPLVALGLAALALRACRLPRMRGTGGADPEPAVSARLALVWILVGGVGAALWLPFGRDNFFLAFAAPVAVAEGVALALPVELARRRLGAREPRGTEAP